MLWKWTGAANPVIQRGEYGGQLSAWYVIACLGFNPVDAGGELVFEMTAGAGL